MKLLWLRNVSHCVEAFMRSQRKIETSEERNQRLMREAQIRRDEAAAEEAAVERMITRNVEQYGP